MASKILITGGTGLVGSRLTEKLKAEGYQVNILTTSATRAETEGFYYWNIKDQYIDQKAVDGIEAIVHLAGAGVADKRWSSKRKKLIYDSRIDSTKLLQERTKTMKLKSFVSASAVGIYGFNTGDEWMNEESQTADDFLARVVKDWEQSVDGLKEQVDRVVKLRIGIVLSPEGGALKAMMPPFKWGVGSPLGSGNQWMSWIHIDDLVDMIHFSLMEDVEGAYNAVGTNPVQNKEFSKTLSKTLGRPMWLPNVPGFVMRIVFGELANVVLGGNRVSAQKITEAGFKHRYNDLEDALKKLLKNDD